MRRRQRQAGEHLVEPLRTVLGTPQFALLHRQPRLAKQIDREHGAMGQQTWEVVSPHRGGRIATRQQDDRTPLGAREAVYPDRSETRWDVEGLVVWREIGQALPVRREEAGTARIAAEVPNPGVRHYSTVTDLARLRGLSTS